VWGRASNGQLGRAFFRRPRGYIDEPVADGESDRAPLLIRGWCLFPGSTTARVELRVGDAPPELARLAVERQDVAALTDHPCAPICGFEHTVDLGALPDATTRVDVEAIARSLDGRSLRLEPVTTEVAPQAPYAAEPAGDTTPPRRRAPRPVRPLRLLAYTHSLAQDGGSLYLVELVRRWVEAERFSCSVVTLADGPLRTELEELGVLVHVTDAGATTSPARYEGHLAELTAWAAPREFDAALVNTLASFPGADLAQRLGIPAVWAVHESYTLPMFWHVAYPPDVPHASVRERAAEVMRRTPAVVFEAEATRRLFLANADSERLLTVPYGIELDTIAAARRLIDRDRLRAYAGIAADTQVVLCLGSIERRKSQAMLAQAFALIAESHPRAQLVIVGETGDRHRAGYQAGLREYVRRAGLEPRIAIEPTTSNPYSWHAIADLLVCASDVESLPRVILEAMAFGTPVLSTSTFGVPELIDDGRTGWLCDTRDVEALADGLDRVLGASAAGRDAVSRAAAEHVIAHHDQATYADRMAELLRDMVAGPAAAGEAAVELAR
jgi:glycosyltransferase involved in cell wall biosynthesis